MKSINVLRPPLGKIFINRNRLKLRTALTRKRTAREIGIIRILQVIFVVAATAGLFVFLGVKLL